MALLNIRSAAKVKFTSTGKMRVVSPGYGYGGGGGGGGLSSGLQAFYRLSDLTDASGNGNTLTNNGGVTFGSGKIGNCVTTDNGKYLSNSTLNLHALNAVSMSCWVSRNSILGGDENIVGSFVPGSGSERVAIFGYSGAIYASVVTSNNGYTQLGGFSTSSNVWTHVAVTYNGSVINLYSDGALIESLNATGTTVTDPSFFGIGAGVGGGTPSNAKIDAVGIWNRALTLGEVSSLYNSGAGIEL